MNNNFNNKRVRDSFHSDRTHYDRHEDRPYDKVPQRGSAIRSNGNRFNSDISGDSQDFQEGYTKTNPGYNYGGQGYGSQTEGHDERWHNVSHEEENQEGVWDKIKNFVGKGPKGYKRSDDRIKEDVCEILERHPRIDASEVEIEVKERIVFLRGQVDSRQTKRLTEDIIYNCAGVHDVRNDLTIVPAQSPDSNIPQYRTEGDHLLNRITPGKPEGYQ